MIYGHELAFLQENNVKPDGITNIINDDEFDELTINLDIVKKL